MTKFSETVASSLLEIEAIKLRPNQPFKWASGWNSPIYCDNRLSLSFPEVRNMIRDGLIALIQDHFKGAQSIAGVATAGIPQGALIADKLNLPFIYVRPKPKDHGMENLIEGKTQPGLKVVVVEDLISTGGSSLKAVEALRDAKVEVLGMVGIFTYGFNIAEENFKKSNVKLVTLSNYDSLITEAVKKGVIRDEELQSLKEWRKDPAGWKKPM
jgi:orotate phosphoribosyltransferase